MQIQRGSQVPSPKSFTPALTWSSPSTLLLTDLPFYLHFRSSAEFLLAAAIQPPYILARFISQVHHSLLLQNPHIFLAHRNNGLNQTHFLSQLQHAAELLNMLDSDHLKNFRKSLYCPLHVEVEGWRSTETNSAPRNSVSGSSCALWHQWLSKNDPSDKVGKNYSEKRPINSLSVLNPIVSSLSANMSSGIVQA